MRTQQAINNFIDSRIAANLSFTTIAWYRSKLKPFPASCPQLPGQPEPIEAFLAGVKGTPENRHAYFRALRALFRFTSERFGTPNPMTKVSPPRCPKKLMATLDSNELIRLLYSATGLRDRAVLTLLLDTGIRSSELASLRKQDIKMSSVTVRGKCGEREVPISEETRRLLLLLVTQGDKGEHVFRGPQGPLTRHGVYRMVRNCMTKAGIYGPKLGGHRIRHAFGKGYLVNGGDVRSLQQIMGHANISTTEKYASLNLNDVISKHHQFTPLRSAHASAQGSLFEPEMVKEAEEIIKGGT